MGIVLDIIVVAILTLCIFLGYRRGLVKVAFSLFAFIASLLISIILYWPITNFVINNTQIDENIEAIIVKNTNEEETQENTGISTYVRNYAENMVSETQDAVVETAARAIAINIVGIGVMILIFVVTRLLLILLGSVANIISNLPIIKQFNEIGGIIYGILKALIIIYVILAILFFIVSVNGNTAITSAIESSYITKMMYNNNIILNILFYTN